MNRRHVLGLLVSAASAALLGGRAGAGPSDQGIGGTGVTPPTDESDRGIGGTGVIGTIKKFGSIVVNDLRIAYPEDATVRIDGRPASVADLKIGQVVRVTATGKEDSLSTRTIDVSHEVVGPVEKVGDKRLTVLGQKVSTDELDGTGFKPGDVKVGDVVAVSGLRRNDGTIAASLIQPSPDAQSRVAGPLKKGADGTLAIGNQEVVAVDPSLVGQRVVLEGTLSRSNHFVAVRTTSEKALLPPSVRKLSIESYVERSGDTLRSGSGYAISGGDFDVPSGRSIRAVLQTNVGTDGRLTIDSLRAGGRTYGGGGFGGRGPGGRGPGGRGPGGKGPGGKGPGGKGPGGRGPGGKGPGGKGKGPGRGQGRGEHGPGGHGGRGFGGRGPGGRGFGRGGYGGGGGFGGGRGFGGGGYGGRGGGFGGGGGYGGGFGGGGGGYGGGGGGFGGGGFGGGGGGGFGGGGGRR